MNVDNIFWRMGREEGVLESDCGNYVEYFAHRNVDAQKIEDLNEYEWKRNQYLPPHTILSMNSCK
jgi:hypothetical protein